jgi:hypothetical protein
MWERLKTVCPLEWMVTGPPPLDNLPLPFTIHTKSHQLLFNSCWNVLVLHNLPPNTNHITCRHLELAYQFVLSSRHSPAINLMISIQFSLHLLHSPNLMTLFQNSHMMPSWPRAHVHLVFSDRERHLWSSKYFFCVFVYAFCPESSSFFW